MAENQCGVLLLQLRERTERDELRWRGWERSGGKTAKVVDPSTDFEIVMRTFVEGPLGRLTTTAIEVRVTDPMMRYGVKEIFRHRTNIFPNFSHPFCISCPNLSHRDARRNPRVNRKTIDSTEGLFDYVWGRTEIVSPWAKGSQKRLAPIPASEAKGRAVEEFLTDNN